MSCERLLETWIRKAILAFMLGVAQASDVRRLRELRRDGHRERHDGGHAAVDKEEVARAAHLDPTLKREEAI
jgi:hypothetical protein